MLKGIVREDGTLQDTASVLGEAAVFGHVDGYPLPILAQMLNVRPPIGPSASQIASITWRRIVLERILDYYAHPRALTAMLRGTLIHKGLQGTAFPSHVKVVTERRLRSTLLHRKDITISGQIDVYYPAHHRLEDYKTCGTIPSVISDEHLVQLAVYYWLLCWAGYTVDSVAIDYIAWDDMRQVSHAVMPDKSIQKAVAHPYFQDVEAFEKLIIEGWEVLNSGFIDYVVPGMDSCNNNWCRYCPLKWACDRIAVEGAVITPADFVQEDYR